MFKRTKALEKRLLAFGKRLLEERIFLWIRGMAYGNGGKLG
jgi:hypothetical protein